MTSWNWVYLTDFAGYKPTFLPEVRLRFPDLRTKYLDKQILTDHSAIVLIKGQPCGLFFLLRHLFSKDMLSGARKIL